jgi:hypothetical protein
MKEFLSVNDPFDFAEADQVATQLLKRQALMLEVSAARSARSAGGQNVQPLLPVWRRGPCRLRALYRT